MSDTGRLLRDLVLGFNAAARSGRDDDLWAVQTRAETALRSGVVHGDLVLMLVQVHLDCHAVVSAETLLNRFPGAAATPTGRMLRSALLLQHGEVAAAGQQLLELAAAEPTWRGLALLAATYEEIGDRDRADRLYADAAELLDAKQLGSLSWLETQRARLRVEVSDLTRAVDHLDRAERAAPGHAVAALRGRWLTAVERWDAAAEVWQRVAEQTGRPDHAQAAGSARARQGRAAEADHWWRRARAGYEAAALRWPWRYAHHLVEWHLDVDHDVVAAVRIAEQDYRQRPGSRPASRLAAAYRAGGADDRAEALLAVQEHRRDRARAELDAAVRRLEPVVAGAQ